ncbi:unnamed protein product [Amoebophrya sp. A120]|nr:unnamed protein product [Amoebophrya sp. A120]|eukprot:GSA120T00009838001.1
MTRQPPTGTTGVCLSAATRGKTTTRKTTVRMRLPSVMSAVTPALLGGGGISLLLGVEAVVTTRVQQKTASHASAYIYPCDGEHEVETNCFTIGENSYCLKCGCNPGYARKHWLTGAWVTKALLRSEPLTIKPCEEVCDFTCPTDPAKINCESNAVKDARFGEPPSEKPGVYVSSGVDPAAAGKCFLPLEGDADNLAEMVFDFTGFRTTYEDATQASNHGNQKEKCEEFCASQDECLGFVLWKGAKKAVDEAWDIGDLTGADSDGKTKWRCVYFDGSEGVDVLDELAMVPEGTPYRGRMAYGVQKWCPCTECKDGQTFDTNSQKCKCTGANQEVNVAGDCVCKDGYKDDGGICVMDCDLTCPVEVMCKDYDAIYGSDTKIQGGRFVTHPVAENACGPLNDIAGKTHKQLFADNVMTYEADGGKGALAPTAEDCETECAGNAECEGFVTFNTKQDGDNVNKWKCYCFGTKAGTHYPYPDSNNVTDTENDRIRHLSKWCPCNTCPNGKFFDPTGARGSNCKECLADAHAPNWDSNSHQCVAECPNGYPGADKVCVACGDRMKPNEDGNACECEDGYEMQGDTCEAPVCDDTVTLSDGGTPVAVENVRASDGKCACLGGYKRNTTSGWTEVKEKQDDPDAPYVPCQAETCELTCPTAPSEINCQAAAITEIVETNGKGMFVRSPFAGHSRCAPKLEANATNVRPTILDLTLNWSEYGQDQKQATSGSGQLPECEKTCAKKHGDSCKGFLVFKSTDDETLDGGNKWRCRFFNNTYPEVELAPLDLPSGSGRSNIKYMSKWCPCTTCPADRPNWNLTDQDCTACPQATPHWHAANQTCVAACPAGTHAEAETGHCAENVLACSCPHGTPVADLVCAANEVKCEKCNAGFHDAGNGCVANECTCDSGADTEVAATGEACPTHGESLCVCKEGLERQSDGTCATTTLSDCPCTHGTGAAGDQCPDKEEKCTECDEGYKLGATSGKCDECAEGFEDSAGECVAASLAPLAEPPSEKLCGEGSCFLEVNDDPEGQPAEREDAFLML